MSNKIRIPHDDIPATINSLLETNFWIYSLKAETHYRRLHDEHLGTGQGEVVVAIIGDGDVGIFITDDKGRPGKVLRFRNGIGGGHSLRVRTALLILAEAIRQDNESDPAPK